MSSDRAENSLLLTGIATSARPRNEVANLGSADRDRARATLMARAQVGEREAYRRLLEDITPFIRRLAARRLGDPSEVEDAVQDVLLTIHVIRHTYDPTRPFAPWLTAIANRRIIDRARRQMRSDLRQVPLSPKHETLSTPGANLQDAGSDAAILRAAIESLPSGQRQAIKLLKLGEMSLKEAAAASGMSVGALKVATHRAVNALRKLLGDQRHST